MKLVHLVAVAALPAALVAQDTKKAAAQKAAPKAAAPAGAPTIPAALVGIWDGKTMLGPKDSVVATSVTTFSADGKVTVALKDRPLMTARVLAAGGDSATIEIGPYESILKKGVQVTTRTTTHASGNTSTGTMEAKYSDGSTTKGKTSATKKAAAAPAKKP